MWKCIEQHHKWLENQIGIIQRLNGHIKDVAIAYLSSNSTDMLFSMMACTSPDLSKSGTHVAALLNTRWSSNEMAAALQSRAPIKSCTLILYGEGYQRKAQQVDDELGHLSRCLKIPIISDRFMKPMREMANSLQLKSEPSARYGLEALEEHGSIGDAMVVFTSGTTGGSKGVRLSHRAIGVQAIAKQMIPCGYSNDTYMLASTVPLFHIGGISSFLAVLFSGGTLVFPEPAASSFDPAATIYSLEHPFLPSNTLVVVPAMLTALLKMITAGTKYPRVKLLLIGGQSASQAMIHQLKEVFVNACIVQTFACTEAASSLTFFHVNATTLVESSVPSGLNGDCVGYPPTHVALRLYKKEGKVNKIVNLPFRPGMIATRGPHLMNGYWSRGSERGDTSLSGWYVTSDIGFFDDHGQLYFCGRARDTIRSGGETIMAQEVERVLLKHPAVSECAVFAKPDDRFGEAVACAIVTTDALQLIEVKRWCDQEGLATYKRPRYLFLVDSLPRNASGKVLKHQLVLRLGKTRSKL